MADVDVVVIGSGAGGLTAALGCAIAGQKVLVVEQHYLPGGWCHSFPLGGYEYSPGVHYIGDLDNGGLMQRLYEGMGLAEHLTFLELNPDGYDHVWLGDDFRFDIPKGLDAYRNRLCERFPHERAGIHTYLDTLKAVADELVGNMASKRTKVLGSRRLGSVASAASFPLRAPNLARWGARPLSHLLNHCVQDPQLRAVLSIQVGDHGLPPSKVPTALHATVIAHYFDGGFYPKGGAKAIPRAYLRELKRHGGSIQLSTEVRRILVEGGRAIGVELGDGTEVRARSVISNADPHLTFTKMLEPDEAPWRLRRKLARTRYSLSNLSLFCAVEMDLEALGYDSGNYWYNRHPDVDGTYRGLLRGSSAIDGLFLTITSLKDRGKLKAGVHTVEVFNLATTASWEDSGPFGARSPGYADRKQRLTDDLVAAAEAVIPGMADHLVFHELGTPATNKFYVRSTDGNMYGTEKSLGQIGPFAFPVRTHLDGLYLCGSSTLGHGVAGATLSGLVAAAKVNRCPLEALLTQKRAGIEIWPADDVEAWPESAQRRIRRREVAHA